MEGEQAFIKGLAGNTGGTRYDLAFGGANGLNATELMRLLGTGLLGLGTSTPSAQLDAYRTTSGPSLFMEGGVSNTNIAQVARRNDANADLCSTHPISVCSQPTASAQPCRLRAQSTPMFQAGTALRLRGELSIHLASIEGEEDGHVVTKSFIDKMEGMTVGARQAHYAFGNQTLVRYLRAQLRILRAELDRLRLSVERQAK